jgi:hypothetical protein
MDTAKCATERADGHYLTQAALLPLFGVDAYDRIVCVHGPASSVVTEAELAAVLDTPPDLPQSLDWLEFETDQS